MIELIYSNRLIAIAMVMDLWESAIVKRLWCICTREK